MAFIAVDLGTTNIKVTAYDNDLHTLNTESITVNYDKRDNWVEFDADEYFRILSKAIRGCCSGFLSDAEDHEIVLTGQAESLVVVGKNGKPLRNAISWLDERSKNECNELAQVFSNDLVYKTTGQVAIIPTWPITKILWIKKNEPEVFSRAHKYLLLKDYIQYRLTGKYLGEYSIYNFSLYFDLNNKSFWHEILDFVGISTEQLPQLIEPCTNIGTITTQAASETDLPHPTTVNVGTLDHFAGMIGTGNIHKGIISESTGTVLSIATLVRAQSDAIPSGIPYHFGPFKDSYILLSTCESGGINLEWYKSNFLKDVDYGHIEKELISRKKPGDIYYLPYLAGVNAPDYEEDASGVFYGLKLHHDRFDLALSVMEGVAFMLARNMEEYKKAGLDIKQIISTGGGSQSMVWSQIKADVTDCEIAVPAEKEAACLGAAMIGAVDKGIFRSFQEAVERCVSITQKLSPVNHVLYSQHYQFYAELKRIISDNFWNSDDEK